MHSLGAILLGLIDICIVVAVLILIGYVVIWLLSLLNFAVPMQVQKIYMVIVALVALYLIVQLLLGVPLNLIGGRRGSLEVIGYG